MVRDSKRVLPTCARHGLSYDPAVAAGCVVCLREARESSRAEAAGRTSWRWMLAVLVTAIAVVAVVLTMQRLEAKRDGTVQATSSGMLDPVEGELTAKEPGGRSGFFLLPPRRPQEPIALLVGFHGTGADGREMIQTFRKEAFSRRFAILAPSSGFVQEAHQFSWRVGDHPNDISTDYTHIAESLKELESRSDVVIDPDRMLAVGFSGGGSSAPYVASNTPPYSAFAVLHGGVFIGGCGSRRVRGWFSTGTEDGIRTPAHVAAQSETMRNAGFDVVFSTYPGGHTVSPEESSGVIAWWLGPA
jgi:predicted esterase